MITLTNFDADIAHGRSYGFVEFKSTDYEVANLLRDPRPGEAPNVVTSLVTSTGLHRPVLDLDVPHDITDSRLRMDVGYMRRSSVPELMDALSNAGIPQQPVLVMRNPYLFIDLSVPYHLVPSSTPGHSHLYLDVDVAWGTYRELLLTLSKMCVVQAGWVNTAVKHERSVTRLPWIVKDS